MSEAQEKPDQADNKPDDKAKKPSTDAKAIIKADTTPPAVTPRKGGGTFIAICALVVAVAAFGAGYKAWQEIGVGQQALAERLNTAESENNTLSEKLTRTRNELNASIQSSAEGIRSTLSGNLDEVKTEISQHLGDERKKVEDHLAQLDQRNSDISSAADKLTQRLEAYNPNTWLVAEGRYLIRLAINQAQLNHNATVAISALEAADQRLRETDDPSLQGVRQILADNIIALRNINSPDITSIALTLSSLEANVANLPLASDQFSGEVPTTPSTAVADTEGENDAMDKVSGFFGRVWQDVQSLVSIRRIDGDEQTGAAILPPGQRFFLQQNLRLKLESARLALLQGDTAVYQESIKTARLWLESYFDTSTAATANTLTTLGPIAGIELNQPLPDITNALSAIDTWLQTHNKAEGGA